MTDTAPEPVQGLDQLATALAEFQSEMPTVAKTHTANVRSDKGSYSYTYAGLREVTDAAMPLLTKHGLSFVTLPGNGVLTGLLLHSSGQSVTGALPIGGGTPQQVGSSLTYMRRYLLGCMTGIVTDDDDDGQGAGQAAKKPRAKASAPAAAAPSNGGISPEQVKLMATLMGKLGMTDRDRALQFVSDVIGHPVDSRNELDKREASAVIDALKSHLDETPDPHDGNDPWAKGGAA